MTKEIRINGFAMNCPGHLSPGLWTHPRDRSASYNDISYWTDLAQILEPPPEHLKILGPAEAPVVRLKNEYRYQFLIKAASRVALNELLKRVRQFALDRKWGATALVIDVDPVTLM